MSCPEGVAKKALRGDDLGTPLAKKGFSGDGGRKRFAKGPAKAQVAEGLFSVEAIIHPVIVTAGAVFGQPSSLSGHFLASGLPNPSPPAHILAILANCVLGGTNPSQSAGACLATRGFRAVFGSMGQLSGGLGLRVFCR